MVGGSVVDFRDQGLILFAPLAMGRKITQVRTRSEDDIDPRNGGNLFGVFDTNGSLNHDDHHYVVIGDLAIVASPQGTVLAVALAASTFGRILGPLHRSLSLLHGVHRGNDNSYSADVGRFLDISLGRVRHANKGHRRRPSAGPNHFGHGFKGQGAVLHLDPQIIVSGFGHGAIDVRVRRENCSAHNRLALFEFLLGRIEKTYWRLLLLPLRYSKPDPQQRQITRIQLQLVPSSHPLSPPVEPSPPRPDES